MQAAAGPAARRVFGVGVLVALSLLSEGRCLAAPATAIPAARAAMTPPAGSDLAEPAKQQQRLTALQGQLPGATNEQQLGRMAAEASAIQAIADNRVAQTEAQLVGVEVALHRRHFDRDRRLTQAQALQKADLVASQANLRAQLQLAQPVANLANLTFRQIQQRRRQSFGERVLDHTSSPLSPNFWTSLSGGVGADLVRLNDMAVVVSGAAWAAPEPRGLAGLALGVLAAVLFLVPVRLWAGGLGWRLGHRLSRRWAFARELRSPAIAWTVVVQVGSALLGAGLARLGLEWGGLLSPPADEFARSVVGAVVWAAAILAIGGGLATASRADRRLLNCSDAVALRGRFALAVVAAVTVAGLLLQKLNFIIGASLAASIAANCAVALAYAVAALLLLISFSPHGAEKAASPDGSPVRSLLALLLAGAAVVTIGAVLLGYTTLAALISGQVFWLGVIAATTFLLLRLIDDLCRLVAGERSGAARSLANLLSLKVSTVVQLGVLVCAAIQLLAILAAVTLALTPFGQSGELLISHVRLLGGAIQVGKATISPAAIAAGITTFGLGVGLVHLTRGWLQRRYLPITDWDTGVRNSVATGMGYLGVALALICALAVTGLSFQQIALVASALSVGIGFGLQQIVQNFVAGVILLIERPVKVGDWVSVAGVEGDVVDIRVRATEIRTLNGSTAIVPNSSLITTNVENKSLPDGRIRVDLHVAVAKPADAARARELILQLVQDHEDVLDNPEPVVFADGLGAGGSVQLSCWFYLPNPRRTQQVRSEMYLALLQAFDAGQITMA